MRHTFACPRNGCSACGEDFAGLAYFDRHHVGTHEYLFSEGLKLNPPCGDGRRCLNADEMRAIGLSLDKNGRWTDAGKSAAVRAHFEKPSQSLTERRRAPAMPETA